MKEEQINLKEMEGRCEEKPILYDLCEAVRNLNKVEGFEPKNYLRKEETEEGVKFYLDTKFRILWYRLKYPEGKVFKIPKVLNKEYATFEVRVYAHKDDAFENFLANGFASRYKDESKEFGLNFVEGAETAALGRALKDAGFGTQFCDVALPNDTAKVDADVQIVLDAEAYSVLDPDNEGFPEGVEIPTDDSGQEKFLSGESKDHAPVNTTKSTAISKSVEKKPVELNKNMSIKELVKLMSVEYAKTVVVDYGYDTGKTLGELAVKKPKSIEFHAARAQNNLIKAGAIVLLEASK